MKNKFTIVFLSLLQLPFFTGWISADQNLMQREIKHVVLLIMENRSFDNVLGWLYDQGESPNNMIPSTDDRGFMGLSDEMLGQYTSVVKNSSGQIVFSSPIIKGIPSVSSTAYLNSPKYDPNEVFSHVTNQIYGFDGSTTPTMTGFLQDYASIWNESEWLDNKDTICGIMETYTHKELPVMHSLAKNYAVSDLWFASVPTQTNPNRGFALCGTSEGTVVNGPLGQTIYHSDTLWNRLHELSPDTTWSIFWQTDDFPGVIPGPYSGTNTFANLTKIPGYEDHIQKIDSFHQLARNGALPDVSLIDPQMNLVLNLTPSELVEYNLSNGQELLVGFQGNDMHPPGDVRTGENLLANIYTSLIANQEAWNHTLFVIIFDEHGGIFDHVAPPAAIAPDDDAQEGFNFDRYGVRIPAIFISPRITKGTVIRSALPDVPFDHTSFIATVLKWKGIDKSLWNLGKRVDAAPTFEDVIQLEEPRSDSLVLPSSSSQVSAELSDVIKMGDSFYLRSLHGEYLTKTSFFTSHEAPVGSEKNKVLMQFAGGTGYVTNGSFVLMRSTDTRLGSNNYLGSILYQSDCKYSSDNHIPEQWWTIKNVDKPHLGAEICYGDRVYLENHIYIDPLLFVSSRLTTKKTFFSHYLITKSIAEKGSEDCFWIIEKPKD